MRYGTDSASESVCVACATKSPVTSFPFLREWRALRFLVWLLYYLDAFSCEVRTVQAISRLERPHS